MSDETYSQRVYLDPPLLRETELLAQQITRFEACIFAYGTPVGPLGTVLVSRQSAIQALNQLELGTTKRIDGHLWTIVHKRIEGDSERGYCYVTFEQAKEEQPQ